MVLQFMIFVHTGQTLLTFAKENTDVSYFHSIGKDVSLLPLIVKDHMFFFWTTPWISICSYAPVSFTVVFQILKLYLLFQALFTPRNGPNPLSAKFWLLCQASAIFQSLYSVSNLLLNASCKAVESSCLTTSILLQLPLLSKIISPTSLIFAKNTEFFKFLCLHLELTPQNGSFDVTECHYTQKALRYAVSQRQLLPENLHYHSLPICRVKHGLISLKLSCPFNCSTQKSTSTLPHVVCSNYAEIRWYLQNFDSRHL